ncbi:hypothetical protein B0H13DRAFT_2295687 [Mycena leptocephala]|nr:hypothetical protein B0H13DRAFT_2295687 [Mycena leptocephala]
MVNPEVPTPRISTFVLYSPKSSPRYEDNSGLSAEDLQTLKNEFAEGGTLVSVYSPDDAMLWLEAHYDDPPLTSMRLLGVGGPIAAMLSPDEPSLVIFGSIHDNSVLAAAGGLSELSGFTITPLQAGNKESLNEDAATSVDDQLAEANQDVNNDLLTNIAENEDMDEDDTTSVASDISMDSTTTEDSDIGGLNNGSGVFRFRGGASKDVDPYEPWMGPVHNVDVRLDIHPSPGVSHKVSLLTKIQFKVQPEHINKHRHGYRPQVVSWTNFRVVTKKSWHIRPDRSYSNICFLVEGQYISQCIAMECDGFIPPQHITKSIDTKTKETTKSATLTGGTNPTGAFEYIASKIKTDTVEYQNDRVTPKCTVHYHPGDDLTIDGTSYESFDIAYEASDDLTNKEEEGAKYPIHAEFSMGINVVDLEDTNNPQLPKCSFLIRNQTNLWIFSDSLKARGRGVVVLTSAHIPNVETPYKLSIVENQRLELAGNSLINVPPTDTTQANYSAKMALSIATVSRPPREPNKEPGILRSITSKFSSLTRRKTVQSDPQIETLRMHEFISRGWDATQQQWRMPIYPSLTNTLQWACRSSDAVWDLNVQDMTAAHPLAEAPKFVGKQCESGAKATDKDGTLPSDKTQIKIGAEVPAAPSRASFTTVATGSEDISAAATGSTSVTSMGTHAPADKGRG